MQIKRRKQKVSRWSSGNLGNFDLKLILKNRGNLNIKDILYRLREENSRSFSNSAIDDFALARLVIF